MKDLALHAEVYCPAAGGTNYSTLIDIGVDISAFSDQWRQGRVTVAVPALPNHTDPTKNVTVTIQDSADGGNTFQTTNPLIQVSIPGVAATGSPATSVDCPLPPGLRGPFIIAVAVPAGDGDCTQALVTADWKIE
jgi:hypothetical protein